MFKGKKVGVVILAAGSGKRMGLETPKQFLKINNRAILGMTLTKFLSNEFVDRVVIAVNDGYMGLAKSVVKEALRDSGGIARCRTESGTKCELKSNLRGGLNSKPGSFNMISEDQISLIVGGAERYDSAYESLKSLKDDIDIVLVHDAARPYVSNELITNIIEKVYEKGSAIPAVKPKDTIRTKEKSLNRDELYMVQTPQGFSFKKLISAYEKAKEDGFKGTDDASLFERIYGAPEIIEGEYPNIKITTKEDLAMNETLMGHGFDVHKLVEGRKCILLGCEIPYEKGLLGHSDADVATHALMDAILGAAGLGDIGKHFPDTSDEFKDISSMVLLKRVKSLIEGEGLRVGNCDITIICERPKVLPYVEIMKENVASVLDIPVERVNVKGTTTEKLGFTGRGEGIASLATVVLYK